MTEPPQGEGPPLPAHLDPRARQVRRPFRPSPAGPRRTSSRRLPTPPTPSAPNGDVLPGGAGISGGRHVGPRRSTRRRLLRAVSWLAVFLSFATLVTAGVGYAFVRQYNGNIGRLGGIFGPGTGDRSTNTSSGPVNILLVGSDTRANLAPGQSFQGTGAEYVTGQRSDTIILAHLYGKDDVAQLISFPRDSWVTIPAYTDPKTGKTIPAHFNKINSALEEGGPPLLVKTIQQLSGLTVDHYAQIDFTGFKTMVDALGGVEICLPKAEREPKSGIDLPAGRSVVKGDQALAYVRQRYGLTRGDIDRIARQQQFLGAIVRKVLSAGTLTNPFKLNAFLNAATKSVQVDDGLSLSGLRDLALRAKGFSSGSVVFSTLPVANPAGMRGGQSVVLLDDAAVQRLFQGIKDDVPPGKAAPGPKPSTATEVLTVAPQDVRVRVYNGAGVQALGARAAADLQSAGFAVVGAPGNRGSGATQTVVLYGPGKLEAARTVAAAIAGSVVKESAAATSALEVVVGSSYAGVQRVQVGQPAPVPSAAPTPTPSPTGTPAITTAAQDPCAV